MSPSTTNVCILSGKTPGLSENRAKKIAEFLGADVAFASLHDALDAELLPAGAALVAHADVLARAAEDGIDVARLSAVASQIFVYGFTAIHAALIRSLSSGAFVGVEAPSGEAPAFRVAADQRECCGQFSGLSICGVDAAKDSVFQPGQAAIAAVVLIAAGTQPFLVRVNQGGAQVFLSGSAELADLNQEVDSRAGLLPWFSSLVPLLMFLKAALGSRVWHNDRPQACFIIDDPLLKPRYGFLQYTKLLEATRGHKFSSSIAFIPWNYRRSRKRSASLFLNESRSLSLCVHGCDHTKAEFASSSPDVLRGQARLALERMRAHTRRSGVPFDEVMVFPQGLFSAEAIEALAASGYIAAVNTDLCPANRPQALPLRSLMDVAVTECVDVPLFGRHYPNDPAEFAFDLFLGKPALAVQHHGYFREGYAALVAFVKRLNGLDERLEWNNLATICTQVCLKKITPQGDVHLRFYTDCFSVTNPEPQPRNYVLFQRRTSGTAVRSVTLNGRPCEPDLTADRLTISVRLKAGESADIRIDAAREAAAPAARASVTHEAGVLVRRLLCELRDNHLEANPLRRTKQKQPEPRLRPAAVQAGSDSIEEVLR
jgi:hypothetical protein